MTTYNVYLVRVDSTTVTVEADDREDAINQALNEVGGPSLCHQCSRGVDAGQWEAPSEVLKHATEADDAEKVEP